MVGSVKQSELLNNAAVPALAKIDIITLGDFDIRFQGRSLLAAHKRSSHILRLLQYLITFRGRYLLPENITDQLQAESDFSDPQGVLRVQVFRLRKILENMYHNSGGQGEPWLHLTYSGGGYQLEIGDQCRVDIDQFNNQVKEADSVVGEDPSAALDLYKEAVNLYKGKYLAGPEADEWLLPWQNRFHRLYLKALLRLLGLLYQKEKFQEIIDIYEQATVVEPYDEGLHIYFLQALLAMGDQKNALSHYNYITSLLYRELGVKPSAPLRALYRRMKTDDEGNHEIDLRGIERRLTDGDLAAGALDCDIDYFQFLWQLEKRRSERFESNDILGLITLLVRRGPLIREEIQTIKEELTAVLTTSLRRGDVFTWWNENQILIYFKLQQRQDLAPLITRLKNKLKGVLDPDRIQINMRFRRLNEESDLLG